uniref:Sulfhydryl oxidase n=1 Tax=Eutreptiella gymnastica TaxID=73025 RepID=A0A7S4LNX3_9EUGL
MSDDHVERVSPESLGRAGWTILHGFAAAYPRQPDAEQRKEMETFLTSWSNLYPCKHCAAHMRDCMEDDPPRLQSRDELSIWMCELHNKVNDLLDKPLFDCSLGAIMDRWTPGGRRKPRANRAKLHDNLDCETTFCPEERRSG